MNPGGVPGLPRVASLDVASERLRAGFWEQPTVGAGVDAFAAALAHHASCTTLRLGIPHVLDDASASRLCAAFTRLTNLRLHWCCVHAAWFSGLGALLHASPALTSLSIANTCGTPLFGDDDETRIEPFCSGLASSRSLSSVYFSFSFNHAPRCYARLLASLVAHPTLITCTILRLGHVAPSKQSSPQVGKALADLVAASAEVDVPLRTLHVPTCGTEDIAAEVELGPLMHALRRVPAARSSPKLSLHIQLMSLPSLDFAAYTLLPAVKESLLLALFKVSPINNALNHSDSVAGLLTVCSSIWKNGR